MQSFIVVIYSAKERFLRGAKGDFNPAAGSPPLSTQAQIVRQLPATFFWRTITIGRTKQRSEATNRFVINDPRYVVKNHLIPQRRPVNAASDDRQRDDAKPASCDAPSRLFAIRLGWSDAWRCFERIGELQFDWLATIQTLQSKRWES